MTVKLFQSDTAAWDAFAAAALSATVNNSTSPEQAASVAAQLADKLFAEREARTKAASDHISGKAK